LRPAESLSQSVHLRCATNAPTVEMAIEEQKTRGELYHNNYLHTGRPSIYVRDFSDESNSLYRNDGDWNFTDVSYQSGAALPSLPWVKWATAFVDIDDDGWLELITVSGQVYPQVDTLPSGGGYRQPKLLQLNQKDGTFCDASDQAGPALQEKRVSHGLAVADLFNDAFLTTDNDSVEFVSDLSICSFNSPINS